jgi:thioredoxin 1
MSSDAIVHVSDASFAQDVLSADVPVLVDFWAAWCGPCKMIAPILDDLAEQYAGKLKIAKVDVDANKEVPGKYGIRGIPTLILFKNGEPAATKVGALSKAQLLISSTIRSKKYPGCLVQPFLIKMSWVYLPNRTGKILVFFGATVCF